METTKNSAQALSFAGRQAGFSFLGGIVMMASFGSFIFIVSLLLLEVFHNPHEAASPQPNKAEETVIVAQEEDMMGSIIREYSSKQIDEDTLQGTFKGEYKEDRGGKLFNTQATWTVTYRFYNGAFFKVVSARLKSLLQETVITVKVSGTYQVKGSVLHYVTTEQSIDVYPENEEILSKRQEILSDVTIAQEPVFVTDENTISIPFSTPGKFDWLPLEKQFP